MLYQKGIIMQEYLYYDIILLHFCVCIMYVCMHVCVCMYVCMCVRTYVSMCVEPSGTSTDWLGILGFDPRTGTYSALRRLSRRTPIMGILWRIRNAKSTQHSIK